MSDPAPPSDLRWACECDCPCAVLVQFVPAQITTDLKLLCQLCLRGDHGQNDDRDHGLVDLMCECNCWCTTLVIKWPASIERVFDVTCARCMRGHHVPAPMTGSV